MEIKPLEKLKSLAFGQSTIQSKQAEYSHLLTFKKREFKLVKTHLAYLGFICDDGKIKCSRCPFKCMDTNVQTFFELVKQHIKSMENTKQNAKCSLKNFHLKYIEEILKDTNSESVKKPEKLPNRLSNVENRIATFGNKEIEINVKELAENGMFLVEDSNTNQILLRKLRCYYCSYECTIFRKGQLNNYYENPVEDHEIKSPDCEIVRKKLENKTEIDGIAGGNIFLNLKNNELNTIPSIQYNNINGNSNFELLKNILNKSVNATCDKPYHPGYATEQSRLDSFRDWPVNLTQQPNDLSKAGFYYYGIKDMVKCFYCNGGLRNWDPIDEPIVEHGRWFPKCPYIRQLKGADFIENIRERYKDMDNGFKDDYDDTPQYYDVVNNDTNNADTKSVPGSAKKRSISPRTINSRMDLPSIQKIIKLGFTRNMVKQVIENKLKETDTDFSSYVDLVKACFKMKENSRIIEQHFQDAFHLYISNITMDVTYNGVCDVFNKKCNVVPILINKIADPNNASLGTLLIRLKPTDVDKCDDIIEKLNQKPFPGVNSQSIIIIKKTKIEDQIQSAENISNKNEKKPSSPTKKQEQKEQQESQNKKFKVMDNEPMDIAEADMAEEVEKLKKERSCAICMERQKVIIFMPCSHLASCVECSVSLQICPICRKKVEATIRTYV